ncbi:type II toxin-antitoxin system Phd/YefM family antitoxin [Sphingomonas sp. PB4P5]|uniref:type II toxin-antitoxin system Phd/YefM family antitoxin n=1 Tax=Parasphingomonas puruogangriensis TaxID=3096155 RepID=UPI002FCB55F8
MKMSVREARANFAHVLDAAERGEQVSITRNGKTIAELGPPPKKIGFDWERAALVRTELGLDSFESGPDEETPFTGPEWTREVWGEYLDNLDKKFADG